MQDVYRTGISAYISPGFHGLYGQGRQAEKVQHIPGEPQTGQETTEEGAAEETAKDAKKPQEEAEKAAGLVKVKAVTRFLDKQLNQIKDAGEAYSVGRERAAELAAAGVAEIVG